MSNISPLFKQIESQKDLFSLHNEHHILGYCYQFVKGFNELPQWQVQYKKQWIHNQTLLQVIENLNLAASERQIQATLLKGIHLVDLIYIDVGSRFMSDIDLLVSSKDLSSWHTLLSESGFKNLRSSTFFANDFKLEWSKKIGDVEINLELHTRLFYYHKEEDWSFTPSPYSSFNFLKIDDLLVHLCGHLAVQHNFSKLYWLMDIKELIEMVDDSIDWNLVKLKAEKSGNLTAIQMCLWVLNKYCDQKIDPAILLTLNLKEKKSWMKFLTIDYLIYPNRNYLNYLILKHLTKDRMITAFRYDLSWVFHYIAKKCRT